MTEVQSHGKLNIPCMDLSETMIQYNSETGQATFLFPHFVIFFLIYFFFLNFKILNSYMRSQT